MSKYHVTTEDGSVYEVETDEAPQSEANRALAGTGLSVSDPKAPPKAELKTPFGWGLQNTVDDALTQGADAMYAGGKAVWNAPTMERKAKGASQIIRGAAQAASPALIPATLANPLATVGRVGAGMLAQKGVEGGAKAIGIPEGYSELAGDVAGGAAAAVGPRAIAGGVQRAVPAIARTVRGAAQGAYEGLGEKSVGGAAAGSALGYMVDGPKGAAVGGSIGGALPSFKGAVEGGVRAFKNAPPPLPPRPQVAPPPLQGSSLPPLPPETAPTPPPPLKWNPKSPKEAAPRRVPPPRLRWNPKDPKEAVGVVGEVEAEAGPPALPPTEPQAGPPPMQRPPGGAATPPPNTITSGAGLSAYDNAPGKFATADEVAQFAKSNGVSVEEAARGFQQAGNKVLDRGGLFREIHDPRYGGVGGHPEIKAQFHKIYPNVKSMSEATPSQLATFLRQVVLKQAMGEFAKGGVVSGPPPMQRAGRRSRRGHWYGPPALKQ